MTIEIGDFARMGHVSVRMLRHYHATGVLIPAEVDPFTGRRAYREDQLPALQHIVLMRDLGFGIAEIRTLLAATPEAADSQLGAQQDQIADQIIERRHQYDRIQALRRLLPLAHGRWLDPEADAGASIENVQVRDIPSYQLAGLRRELGRGTELAHAMEAQFDDAEPAMDAVGASRIWPIARYDDTGDADRGESGNDHGVELITGFVCDRVPEGLDALSLHSARVASLIHHGPMHDIGATHRQLDAWAKSPFGRAEGARTGAPRRLVFYTTDDVDASNWIVEVQLELG